MQKSGLSLSISAVKSGFHSTQTPSLGESWLPKEQLALEGTAVWSGHSQTHLVFPLKDSPCLPPHPPTMLPESKLAEPILFRFSKQCHPWGGERAWSDLQPEDELRTSGWGQEVVMDTVSQP